MAEISMTAKLAAEFIGTFLLILTVGCNVLSGNAVWGAVSIACVLMVSIYALGGISGANFNPAVSVALVIAKRLEPKDAGAYIGVQLAGGVVAAFTYTLLFGNNFTLSPAKGFGFMEAGLCELLYTFMLCFVVLNVAVSDKGDGKKCPNQYYGLSIGFVIVAGAYGAGAVSGGCFNPAVAFGIDCSSLFKGGGWSIVYVIFELIGAAMAAFLWKMCRPEEVSEEVGEPASGSVEVASKRTMTQKLLSEFLGTFILILTVGLNVLGKSKAGAFSIAASLMCMIYALGDVSGAHFNPAVTLTCKLSGRCPDMEPAVMAQYMGAQIAGGVLAAFTYAGIYHGASFGLGAKAGFGWLELGLAEFTFTFVLCFVVLCCAVAGPTKTSDMFGLCIGSCVTVGGLAIGGISGGSLNPAVSMGIAAAHVLNGGFFWKAILYSIFEFAGAAAAAGLFHVTHAVSAPTEKSPEAEA